MNKTPHLTNNTAQKTLENMLLELQLTKEYKALVKLVAKEAVKEYIRQTKHDNAEQKARELTIPETGFVRLPQVLSVIPVCKSSWWEGVKSGRFPRSVKLSVRRTAWKAEDIHDLIKRLS